MPSSTNEAEPTWMPIIFGSEARSAATAEIVEVALAAVAIAVDLMKSLRVIGPVDFIWKI